MQTVKKRIFCGTVCEQIVYNMPDNVKDKAHYMPRPRFKDESEREAHKIGISRRKHARYFNENFRPGDLYSTLTFDAEDEIHDFKTAKKIRDNYVRTLKYANPDAVIFIYMGRGKTTHRIHFHMVSSGLTEDQIMRKWKYGCIARISPLREHNRYDGVDHGADYTGLANYLFDHWTKEQGGHRWKMTKNAREPEEEAPKAVRIAGGYSEKRAPRAPKGYILVEASSTKYGCYTYKYVIDPKAKSSSRKGAGRSLVDV